MVRDQLEAIGIDRRFEQVGISVWLDRSSYGDHGRKSVCAGRYASETHDLNHTCG